MPPLFPPLEMLWLGDVRDPNEHHMPSGSATFQPPEAQAYDETPRSFAWFKPGHLLGRVHELFLEATEMLVRLPKLPK
ncbi:hypothetical protein AURDEDRAFT_166523 [Auricularia subglabra TFB-10046 SS5]|nr:hypothetical protein AURDEDRAFT_166523 [Auricularia subglabra TFB-10046 SS5]